MITPLDISSILPLGYGLLDQAIATASAAAASLINAVAGGGTFLTFPVLTDVAGLSPLAANTTSTVALWPGAGASAIAARPELARLPRPLVRTQLLISIAGGTLGAVLLLLLGQAAFSTAIPWLIGFATLLFAVSPIVNRWQKRQIEADASPEPNRPAADRAARRMTRRLCLVQAVIALYGGYFGAGIGVLMLAGLGLAGLHSIHQLNALKVLLAAAVNLAALVVFIVAGAVDWSLALPMAIASTITGYYGVKIARRVPATALRTLIVGIGIILTILYAHR